MSTIKTYPFQSSTILRINSEQDVINFSPEYQRNGDIWTLQKKQLLIDSILNDYDIPKLYFHTIPVPQQSVDGFEFAIVDGRQRIEAILQFINGDFALSNEFEYFADSSVKAQGLNYNELAKAYPKLKIRFDSYLLPIILVETDDLDLIEDMFSRLNEAAPLNAAEKRNALGGVMAKLIRQVADNTFFNQKVKFSNKRFQHREVAARLLFVTYSIKKFQRVFDTKKPFLDKMVSDFKDGSETNALEIYDEVINILNIMNKIFVNDDSLLRSQGNITVYFLLFREAIKHNAVVNITRNQFLEFNAALDRNRKLAETDITKANYEYLEFERMTQQGTNDASSIKERTRILAEFLGIIPHEDTFLTN